MSADKKERHRPSMFARMFWGAKDETSEEEEKSVDEEKREFRELSTEELESHNSEHIAGKNLQDLAFGGDTIMEDQEGEERSTEVSSKYKDGDQMVREMEQDSYVNETVEEKRKRLEIQALRDSSTAGSRTDFWKARRALPLPPLTKRAPRVSTASSITSRAPSSLLEGEEGGLMGTTEGAEGNVPLERDTGLKTKMVSSLSHEQRSIFRRYHIERAKSLVGKPLHPSHCIQQGGVSILSFYYHILSPTLSSYFPDLPYPFLS